MQYPEKKIVLTSIETGLGSVYTAENKISQALSNMISSVSSPELSEIMKLYRTQADIQMEKIKSMLSILGKNSAPKNEEADYWLEQCEEAFIKHSQRGARLDRSICSLLQKVVLSKICTYHVLFSYTQSVRFNTLSNILDNMIKDERPFFMN